ncbi:unnamed protein product [Amoebophrya sp. A120]|nr:unnamed protein product [Amoebophrya sp. A120]|eukprot:GSA120T00012007001.1
MPAPAESSEALYPSTADLSVPKSPLRVRFDRDELITGGRGGGFERAPSSSRPQFSFGAASSIIEPADRTNVFMTASGASSSSSQHQPGELAGAHQPPTSAARGLFSDIIPQFGVETLASSGNKGLVRSGNSSSGSSSATAGPTGFVPQGAHQPMVMDHTPTASASSSSFPYNSRSNPFAAGGDTTPYDYTGTNGRNPTGTITITRGRSAQHLHARTSSSAQQLVHDHSSTSTSSTKQQQQQKMQEQHQAKISEMQSYLNNGDLFKNKIKLMSTESLQESLTNAKLLGIPPVHGDEQQAAFLSDLIHRFEQKIIGAVGAKVQQEMMTTGITSNNSGPVVGGASTSTASTNSASSTAGAVSAGVLVDWYLQVQQKQHREQQHAGVLTSAGSSTPLTASQTNGTSNQQDAHRLQQEESAIDAEIQKVCADISSTLDHSRSRTSSSIGGGTSGAAAANRIMNSRDSVTTAGLKEKIAQAASKINQLATEDLDQVGQPVTIRTGAVRPPR